MFMNIQTHKADMTPEKIKNKTKISDVSEILVLAKTKFEDFDKNGNGVLDGDEILHLSDWVLSNFSLQANGRPIRKIEKTKMATDLLNRCDKNDDGRIDYDEFAEWFIVTVNNFKKKGKFVPAKQMRKKPSYADKLDGRDDNGTNTPQTPIQESYYRTKKLNRKEQKRKAIMASPWLSFLKPNQSLARN
eukprot:UN23406